MGFFLSIIILWFIRTAKSILFWLYLWQLKEYHIGRFVDHFRTTKGQQIFLNWLFGGKLVLAAGFFIFPAALPAALFVLYFFESAKVLQDTARGVIRKPVFTAKVFFLAAVEFAAAATAAVGLFIFFPASVTHFAFGLLLFDIFAPVFVSAIVLAFQPFAVLARMQVIEKAKRKRTLFPKLVAIGITGSYGKTSTKEFLATILSEKFHVLKTREHQNSEVGVAQCILRDLRPEHEVFVCEMGAYGKGGIKLLCDIAKPKIGILTGINEQHMATFGSQEKIMQTKFELIESLPEEGTAILNFDNDKIKNQIAKIKNKNQKLKKIIFYSIIDSNADIWAEDIHAEKEHVSFLVLTKNGDRSHFRVHVLGAHYVPNLLAAVAAAKELGMTLEEIAQACKKITPQMAGMTMKKGINGATIINATYSANPDGVISHVEYLKIWPGRKLIIMPCLIELGRASKEAHQRIGRKIGEVCDGAIITTKERLDDLKSGAREAGMREESILFLENPKEIFEKIKEFSADVILLEGRLQKSFIELVQK